MYKPTSVSYTKRRSLSSFQYNGIMLMIDRPPSSRLLLFVGILPVLLLTVQCTSSSEKSESGSDAASTVEAPDSINTLTDAQRTAGWSLLFDGSTLENWRGFARDTVPRGWTVENGAMHFTGEASSQDGEPPLTLITADQYSDFELRIEWKISPDGNSGIMYRVSEEEDLPYETGPEYQLLDNSTLGDDGKDVHRTGGLYGLYAPSQDVANPVGQYNETRIVARETHVEHWLNGTKLLEVEIGSDTWKKRVKGTKFANWPRFAQPDSGHIALQDHGYPVWFRDVKIRRLEASSE